MARLWLITSLLLMVAVYSTGALKCYFCDDCLDEQPPLPAECKSSVDACGKWVLGDIVMKSCVPKSACEGGDALMNVVNSINTIVRGSRLSSVHCCDTDGCNGAGLPAPAALLLLTVPLIANVLLR
ncbi:uncharacterized protein LOC108666395 isoform X2 [Hyalella azteca]|nr:uncharacterized protein LOC108666395 isoform X2 [Hyalella azteca]XP_018008755.1 uncharacterized protein LOC108666395 isoform X2 [Hyalella azteca]